GTKPINVLAAPLPRRHLAGTSIAGEDLPFLEVDVDRVIPAPAVVLQGPDLAGAIFWRCRDPTEVRVELVSIVRPDAPGAAKRRDGVVGRLVGAIPEHERPVPGDGNLREIGVRDHHGWHLADVRSRWIADDPKLEELADARIARTTRERLG